MASDSPDAAASPTVTEPVDGVHDITWAPPGEGPDTLARDRLRTYLFAREGETPTLVDTCWPGHEDRLLAGIEQVGVEPERLLITHRHLDHVGGIDAVVDRYDPAVWYPAEEDVRAREEVSTPADERFADGDRIGRFTAVHVPGHTPGNSCFVDEAAGIAVLGDTMNGADRRGLPGGYLVHPASFSGLDLDAEAAVAAERNLTNLLEYEFDVALVNHGSSVFEGAGAKLYYYMHFEPPGGRPEDGH
ncbi:MBL fold metallo-hydrolase [Haloglomus litoreum]|uniref:MBL fold metallo-hydrolase n=1 Tax=Haloglomus litoreum TaxID=3034026 RepID=UPI0023E8AD9C|nr:MBL fold metallo-hydrolase [Haloglomus sp. DT116]